MVLCDLRKPRRDVVDDVVGRFWTPDGLAYCEQLLLPPDSVVRQSCGLCDGRCDVAERLVVRLRQAGVQPEDQIGFERSDTLELDTIVGLKRHGCLCVAELVLRPGVDAARRVVEPFGGRDRDDTEGKKIVLLLQPDDDDALGLVVDGRAPVLVLDLDRERAFLDGGGTRANGRFTRRFDFPATRSKREGEQESCTQSNERPSHTGKANLTLSRFSARYS